jgi:hypothetical protein
VILPGAIAVGTLLAAADRLLALGLVIGAAALAPVLLIVAVLGVVRGPQAIAAAVAVAGAAVALAADGYVGQVAASIETGLACLALGVAIHRLIPQPWLPVAVLVMCAVDVLLLPSNAGHAATAAMNAATAHFHGPILDRGRLGSATIDYPDLVLAGLLGAVVAANRHRRAYAAILLTALAAAEDLLDPGQAVPGTVPGALTLLVVCLMARRGVPRLRSELVAPLPANPAGT